ncbi:hypothetical protein [Hymenobacter edaphi]|uniref:Uncharacterized protein n=1 Tax=Hymenobacter edaphi TaxID=2211146 RepID=A0A328BGX9_9BACT|nr:hypothetical protein [Hymenobacter edaphi]RAK65809.1 hypothetical protein DLM85_13910 [Hymenobacter edaphi]
MVYSKWLSFVGSGIQFVTVVVLSLSMPAQAQQFLPDYKRVLRRTTPTPRRAQQAELTLLSELFTAHQRQTGRSFNEADTIHILTETPSEITGGYAPYSGMVWNSVDTVAFTLEYDVTKRPATRTVQYQPFLVPCQPPMSDCSRQVLVRLVAGQRFEAARQLAHNNQALDGSYTQVASATKTPKGYRIVSFTLPAFMLPFTDKHQYR